MYSVDEESKKFINWAEDQISDDEAFSELIEEIREDIASYFDMDQDKLKRILIDKLTRGCIEHGPIDPNRNFNKDIEDEDLDEMGWRLMKKYVELKKDEGDIT